MKKGRWGPAQTKLQTTKSADSQEAIELIATMTGAPIEALCEADTPEELRKVVDGTPDVFRPLSWRPTSLGPIAHGQSERLTPGIDNLEPIQSFARANSENVAEALTLAVRIADQLFRDPLGRSAPMKWERDALNALLDWERRATKGRKAAISRVAGSLLVLELTPIYARVRAAWPKVVGTKSYTAEQVDVLLWEAQEMQALTARWQALDSEGRWKDAVTKVVRAFESQGPRLVCEKQPYLVKSALVYDGRSIVEKDGAVKAARKAAADFLKSSDGSLVTASKSIAQVDVDRVSAYENATGAIQVLDMFRGLLGVSPDALNIERPPSRLARSLLPAGWSPPSRSGSSPAETLEVDEQHADPDWHAEDERV